MCNCVDCPFDVRNSNKELFYEIHITVEQGNLSKFKEDCSELGVKPILLDLYIDNHKPIKDLMTSSKHKADDTSIIIEAEKIADALKERGYNIVRVKIETVPWHPSAPSRDNLKFFAKGQYFESHLAIKYHSEDYDKLVGIVDKLDLHLSKNILKTEGEIKTIMATMRWYDGVIEDFRNTLSECKTLIEFNNFDVEKEIIEFTLFDSRIEHDELWINRL